MQSVIVIECKCVTTLLFPSFTRLLTKVEIAKTGVSDGLDMRTGGGMPGDVKKDKYNTNVGYRDFRQRDFGQSDFSNLTYGQIDLPTIGFLGQSDFSNQTYGQIDLPTIGFLGQSDFSN